MNLSSEAQPRAAGRRRPLAAVGIVAVLLSIATPGWAATEPPNDGQFPPRANSVWMYDRNEAGEFEAGLWVDLINEYNTVATPGNELGEVFSYATDMETYCPDALAENCTLDDLHVYYGPDANGRLSTAAYARDLDPIEGTDGDASPVLVSPIIDGQIGPDGYLTNFDDLPEELARGYADTAAELICSDEHIDGIQFDLEPFDVTTRNGQYYFYLQIAENFAGGDGSDPWGCVDEAHPQGRFFSFFTFVDAIEPGSESAANVADIVSARGNGYMVASLYNLNNRGPGKLDGLPAYTETVKREVANMKAWAVELDVPYGFGIPASASSNEYTTCDGPDCEPDVEGVAGYRMLDYTKAATQAMHDNDIDADPLFRGVAIWDFGHGVNVQGNAFGPAPAPAEVMLYFSHNLIRPDSAQPGDGDDSAANADAAVDGGDDTGEADAGTGADDSANAAAAADGGDGATGPGDTTAAAQGDDDAGASAGSQGAADDGPSPGEQPSSGGGGLAVTGTGAAALLGAIGLGLAGTTMLLLRRRTAA